MISIAPYFYGTSAAAILAGLGGEPPLYTHTPSYLFPWSIGDRTGLIDITTSASLLPYTEYRARMINGETGNDFYFNHAKSNAWITFDFRTPIKLVEIKWQQMTTADQGLWSVQGSEDNVTFTDILTGVAIGDTLIKYITLENVDYYRYYRLQQTSGLTSNTAWLSEVEFKLAPVDGYLFSPFPTYSNPMAQGVRTDKISVTASAGLMANGTTDVPELVNGVFDNLRYFNRVTNGVLTFQFPVPVRIDGFWLRANGSDVYGEWVWESSNDGSSWTQSPSGPFILQTSGAIALGDMTEGSVYHRIRQISGAASNAFWLQEVLFKLSLDTRLPTTNIVLRSAVYSVMITPPHSGRITKISKFTVMEFVAGLGRTTSMKKYTVLKEI